MVMLRSSEDWRGRRRRPISSATFCVSVRAWSLSCAPARRLTPSANVVIQCIGPFERPRVQLSMDSWGVHGAAVARHPHVLSWEDAVTEHATGRYADSMDRTCMTCRQFDAPVERGIRICRGCTRLLRQWLANPETSPARRIDAPTYAHACEVCGEYRDRRILLHPEWGRVCEVDVREASEFYEGATP